MTDKNENSWWRYSFQTVLSITIFIFSFVWHLGWSVVDRFRLAPAPENTLESKFKVYIYEDELENIREWVRKHDNIETGGDLFGLWIDQQTAIVQLVLGPGRNCRRSTTSFYQDIDYLGEIGSEITSNHGLCNIGQWHSHHRLGLPKPSTGDENTVWGNMPSLGMERFVVIIATISGDSRQPNVKVNPFLFEIESGEQRPVIQGICEVLNAPYSPLRQNENILRRLEDGAESMNITEIKKRPNTSVNMPTLT